MEQSKNSIVSIRENNQSFMIQNDFELDLDWSLKLIKYVKYDRLLLCFDSDQNETLIFYDIRLRQLKNEYESRIDL